MTIERQDTNQLVDDGPGEETIERLFRYAQPRARPPEADERFVRDALYAEWDQLTGRRQRRARATRWAMAASVLVLVGALTLILGPTLIQSPPQIAAHVDRVLGNIELKSEDGAWHALPADSGQVHVDQALRTSPGAQVAIRLASGGALRLDQNSELHLKANGEVELARGALYFDSRNDRGPPGKIEVSTDFGLVRNIGTMFAARVSESTLDVRVREGEVHIHGGPHERTGRAGERIVLSVGGPVQVSAIDVYGESWEWVEVIAPAFDLEGRKVVEFLEWVARETGRRVEYETVEVERMAEEDLHGLTTTGNLGPLTALGPVLMTADLKHELRGDVIFISRLSEVAYRID